MTPSSERILARIAHHMIWIPWAFGAPIDPRWPVPPRNASGRPEAAPARHVPRPARPVAAAGRGRAWRPSPAPTTSA